MFVHIWLKIRTYCCTLRTHAYIKDLYNLGLEDFQCMNKNTSSDHFLNLVFIMYMRGPTFLQDFCLSILSRWQLPFLPDDASPFRNWYLAAYCTNSLITAQKLWNYVFCCMLVVFLKFILSVLHSYWHLTAVVTHMTTMLFELQTPKSNLLEFRYYLILL